MSDGETVAQLTPGGMLSAQREKKGLGQHAAADALKISLHRLKSIEGNDFSGLPSEIYVKGHLRNYARLVGLDEQLVLEVYQNFELGNSANNDLSQARPVEGESKSVVAGFWLAGILLIVVLMWAGLNGWMEIVEPVVDGEAPFQAPLASVRQEALTKNEVGEGEVIPESPLALSAELESAPTREASQQESQRLEDQGQEQLVVPEIEQQTALAIDDSSRDAPEIVVSRIGAAELLGAIQAPEAEPLEPVSQSVPDKLASSAISTSTSSTADTAATTTTSTTKPNTNPNASANRGEVDTLLFRFENECWLEVKDADGQLITASLRAAGSELVLQGRAPFAILIGNINGTSLSLNDEPVKLLARGNRKTLRLSLGE